MNRDAIPRLNRHFRLQWEPAQDCHVLLYPEGMVKLNGSAGLILSEIDGERSVADIVVALEQQFPGVDTIAEDILSFLETAQAQRWVDIASEA